MILQIYRDHLKAGTEAKFRIVEEDAARICAELKFPHGHLAIESLTGPKEVWWLNAFESEAEQHQVAKDYTSNRALVETLDHIAKRKEELTTPVNTYATYRADLSRGVPWTPAGARCFVVTVTQGAPRAEGPVFEATDGTRFVMRPAPTRQEADAAATAAGPGTTVFAVRPYWGMPAKEWIAADPEFWKSNPMARAK